MLILHRHILYIYPETECELVGRGIESDFKVLKELGAISTLICLAGHEDLIDTSIKASLIKICLTRNNNINHNHSSQRKKYEYASGIHFVHNQLLLLASIANRMLRDRMSLNGIP